MNILNDASIITTLVIAFFGAYGFIITLGFKTKQNTADIEAIVKARDNESTKINNKLDDMSTEIKQLCIVIAELSGYIKGKECKDGND